MQYKNLKTITSELITKEILVLVSSSFLLFLLVMVAYQKSAYWTQIEYRKGVDSKQDIKNTFVDEARSVSTTLDGHPDCSGDVKIVKQDYN